MKLLARLKHTAAVTAAGLLLSAPAHAQVTTVKPEDGSKHFAAVSKHLELGGLFFTYIDIDGDFSKLASMLDRIVDLARKEQPAIPEGLKVSKVAEELGLNCVKAIGMSSRRLGDDLYHNRALIYMPEGPKGLMKLFGGKPAPYQVASLAPADAGMAAQVELNLGTLMETIEAVIKSTGDDSTLSQFKAGLSFPVPGAGMSIGEFIGKLNTRVMTVARIDSGKKLSIPGAPVEIPGIQLMIAFDDIDFLMQPLLGMLGETDAAEIEKGEGFTIIRPRAALPGELSYFRPALYHDAKSKRIILTTHIDMAKSAGTGNTLAGSEAFKKAMAGLPAEGNGLTYATPEFIKSVMNFYRDALKASTGSAGSPEILEEVSNILFEFLPEGKSAIAGTYANVPEGMLFASNMAENHKHTLVQAAVLPAAFLAGVTAGFSRTMESARIELEERAERPRVEEREENAPEASGKAVKNNLQQIAFAAQTYFIDNPKAKSVTYETLVKEELIFDLDAVAGESYKGLTLKRGGGEISVKTEDGESISLKYQATTD